MSKYNAYLLSAALIIAVVSAVVGFQTDGTKAETSTPVTDGNDGQSGESSSTTVQTPSDQTEVKVVLLTIRPTGFEPGEITLPAGQYLVVIRNRTGLDEFALRVERDTGEILLEVPGRRFKRDWKQILQLAPGTYVVKETNHPDWICRISITS